MLASEPHQGGATWAALQYVLGLRRLGHDVLFVESVDDLAPARLSTFSRVVGEFGLSGSAALVAAGSRSSIGLDWPDVHRRCARADVLLNLAGTLRETALVERIPVRVYVDLDPAFNQLWAAADGIDMGFAAHTHFVTVGQLIGTDACSIPTCGRAWATTLPPVVLERWPVATERPMHGFTTIGNWRAYGSIEFQGTHYGQKAHSMRRLVRLAQKTAHPLEVALAIDPAEKRDIRALTLNGWRLLDARAVAGTPTAYGRFIRTSLAEIGIAKAGYVDSRCGWFSDRSACYLAAGRPVVAQDTGFAAALPVGEGLLTFTGEEDAAFALDAIHADYRRHSRAARAIAEEHLDSDRVLHRLLALIGVA